MSQRGFLSRLRPGGPCLLMLDFDGTLAAIRKDRRRARMGPEWKRLLVGLGRLPEVKVAFISGRAQRDLRRLAAVPGAWWVSNHGLDWHPPRLGPSTAQKAAWRKRNARALKGLRGLLNAFPGLDIDAKGLDISLHLRRLSPGRQLTLASALAPILKRNRLDLHKGRSVFELRPLDGWDKGDAVRRLRGQMPAGCPSFFAGDDRTDEHGFVGMGRSLPCLSFKVGRGPSAAMVQGSRDDLMALLKRIHSLLK